MNCADCHLWMQHFLDGEGTPEAAEAAAHRGNCPSCREEFTLTIRLSEGLRQVRKPMLPPGFCQRVVTSAMHERRVQVRWRRGLYAVTAAAAVVLVAIGVKYFQPREEFARVEPAAPQSKVQEPVAEVQVPSLRDSVAEAGSAVVKLTRKTADDTVEQTRLLFRLPITTPEIDETGALRETLEPPAQSFRDAGHQVSAGLEPVTRSARRAVDLFLREIPPLEAVPKSGL